MGSFGIGRHAHIEAAFFAVLLTLSAYGIKWGFDLKLPDLMLGLPAFIAVFIGCYAILFVAFLIVWSRK